MSWVILVRSFYDRCSLMELHSTDPTVLWRLTRGRSVAHATVLPTAGRTTLTWYFDNVLDRAENFESVALALARADEIRHRLLAADWQERDAPTR